MRFTRSCCQNICFSLNRWVLGERKPLAFISIEFKSDHNVPRDGKSNANWPRAAGNPTIYIYLLISLLKNKMCILHTAFREPPIWNNMLIVWTNTCFSLIAFIHVHISITLSSLSKSWLLVLKLKTTTSFKGKFTSHLHLLVFFSRAVKQIFTWKLVIQKMQVSSYLKSQKST